MQTITPQELAELVEALERADGKSTEEVQSILRPLIKANHGVCFTREFLDFCIRNHDRILESYQEESSP